MTSTVLAHAILREGLRSVTAGASAIEMKRGLDRGARVAVETIRSLSRPRHHPEREGPGRDDLSTHDAAIGTLIGDGLADEKAKCEGDERTGVRILRRAPETPARQIATNSGADGSVVVERMRSGKASYRFDAARGMRGMYVDLINAGIVDPTKVVRIAPQNAVSVSGVLLLTEGD
jgi:chaperonin GroEL (HSP60 family)